MKSFKQILKENKIANLDKLINKLASKLGISSIKPVSYKSGAGIVPNQRSAETNLSDQKIFDILKAEGFKKGQGYQSKPNEWVFSNNREEMTSVSDQVFLRSGSSLVSASISKEHGSKNKIIFTHH